MRIWFPSETGFIKAVPARVTFFPPAIRAAWWYQDPCRLWVQAQGTNCGKGLHGDFAQSPESSVLFLSSLLCSPSHFVSYNHTQINSQLHIAGKSQQPSTETRKCLTGYKEKCFPPEDSQALGPIVQGGLYHLHVWRFSSPVQVKH